jgi:TPR repeat protein
MKIHVSMVTLATILMATNTGHALADERMPPENECDRLAAHPDDPGRVGGGIRFGDINAPAAIAACESAAAAHPGALRFEYQLGRALDKADRYKEALGSYRKAADRGYAAAQYALGHCYHFGLSGVQKDPLEAIRWLSLAAGNRHSAAMNSLGYMYRDGDGVEKSGKEARKWFLMAAQTGDAVAMYNLALELDDNVDAVRWYRKAAESGYPKAANNLGWAYERGQGVEKDLSKAVYWYKKAADLGLSQAMVNLGRAYGAGNGVAQNVEEARRWFNKAAELEHPQAMFEAALLEPRPAFKTLPTLGYDCAVRMDTKVYSAVQGPSIGTASAGQPFYMDRWWGVEKDQSGAEWSRISELSDKILKEVGVVKSEDLDCSHKNDEYPVVLNSAKTLWPLGIDFNFKGSGQRAGFHRCFYNGDGQNALVDLSLSRKFLVPYRAKAFDFRKLCLVMRAGIIRFDPETGRRLATFIMTDPEYLNKGDEYLGLAISEENPIEVPECFNKGEIEQPNPFSARLTLTGCSMKYHPWSGRSLTEWEQAFWRTAAIVVSSESAPDPQEEAIRVVREGTSSASEADIARMKRVLSSR